MLAATSTSRRFLQPLSRAAALSRRPASGPALPPQAFLDLVQSRGTTFFTGVPDSLLKEACACISDTVPSTNHVITANEGTAVAAAAGHHMATGQVPLVYLQNSGIGNTVNPLLSLASPRVYSVPMLLMLGWRGEPGVKDEPQHVLQGEVMCDLLRDMAVPYDVLPADEAAAAAVLDSALEHCREHQGPYALLVKKGTFDKYVRPGGAAVTSPLPTNVHDRLLPREAILGHIASVFPSSPLVTTTGFCSREMFEMRVANGQGHDHDFLTVGSMGHCSSIALGIALSRPKVETIAVDGDGAAIMHMGAFVTAGTSGASNFKHILINNGMHDSVGGQLTGAAAVDFCGVASACGYASAKSVAGPADAIVAALQELKAKGVESGGGPSFLEILASPGARADLGRPTTGPVQNKDAFMSMLRSKAE